MKRASTRFVLALLLLFATTAWAQLRPVHTFSIVAHDPQTGDLGVAVQSHWFAVGPTVSWAEAGVGAIASQAFSDPSYGKLGLDLMRVGRSARDALGGCLAADCRGGEGCRSDRCHDAASVFHSRPLPRGTPIPALKTSFGPIY